MQMTALRTRLHLVLFLKNIVSGRMRKVGGFLSHEIPNIEK